MKLAEMLRDWAVAMWGRSGLVAMPPAAAPTEAICVTLPVVMTCPAAERATTKARVDAFLTDLTAHIAAHDPPPIPSIIITGALRCGKIIVAQDICGRTGMIHIPTDRIRDATYGALDGPMRARVIRYIYKRILLAYPTGLVLEGSAFLDRHTAITRWAHARGIKVFAFGYALDDVGRKARSMIRYRQSNSCWTSQAITDEGVWRMARRIVRRSRDIRDFFAQRRG